MKAEGHRMLESERRYRSAPNIEGIKDRKAAFHSLCVERLTDHNAAPDVSRIANKDRFT